MIFLVKKILSIYFKTIMTINYCYKDSEYKVMTEIFSESEFKYIAFHSGQLVSVQIIN